MRLRATALTCACWALACGSDDPGGQCESETAGPTVTAVVTVPSPAGPSVRIDATEVTWAQYGAFLDGVAEGAIAEQPSHCRWNTTFEPDEACLATDIGFTWSCPMQPQVCVDWCDAAAYCEHVGKRLCGALGGGPVPPGDFGRTSEWIWACTAGGRYEYAFGEPEDAAVCNGSECLEAGECSGIVEVGSLDSCQSPDPEYAGIFDLAGNVAEWTNACEGTSGASDPCVIRGGSALLGGGELSCYTAPLPRRDSTSQFIGFRCCSD